MYSLKLSLKSVSPCQSRTFTSHGKDACEEVHVQRQGRQDEAQLSQSGDASGTFLSANSGHEGPATTSGLHNDSFLHGEAVSAHKGSCLPATPGAVHLNIQRAHEHAAQALASDHQLHLNAPIS